MRKVGCHALSVAVLLCALVVPACAGGGVGDVLGDTLPRVGEAVRASCDGAEGLVLASRAGGLLSAAQMDARLEIIRAKCERYGAALELLDGVAGLAAEAERLTSGGGAELEAGDAGAPAELEGAPDAS